MPEAKTPARLRADGIAFSYGEAPVIEAVSLEVPDRSFTVLLGPNGCGKSTLLKTLAGMLPLSHGTITLDGRPIGALSVKEIARRVAVLPQGPASPEGLTVRGLVEQGRYPHRSLFGRWSNADAAACASALELTALADLADRRLDTLSGGQRQRAFIAMTLAQETDILLLDEPTTFLDLSHQIEVLDLVLGLVRARGKTVVAVLHDLNQAARYADRLVLMKGGSIACEGTPDAVLTEARVQDVFGVACRIIADPVSGAPLCIPLTGAPKP